MENEHFGNKIHVTVIDLSHFKGFLDFLEDFLTVTKRKKVLVHTKNDVFFRNSYWMFTADKRHVFSFHES